MGFLTGAFAVLIDGNDVTSRWQPTLKELSVERTSRRAEDSFDATLADIDGNTVLPQPGAQVEIQLGHEETGVGWVFSGFVTKATSRGAKGSGREISVTGSSVDRGSKVKAPALRHKDQASFSDVAQEFGSKAGLQVQVLGSLAGLQRAYWLQQHESFLSWGQRMARDLGATFKIIGSQAFFTPRNEGFSVSGQPLPTITGTWGDNLEGWSIEPEIAHPQFQNVITRHYDLKQAKWVEKTLGVDGVSVPADLRPLLGRGTQDEGDQQAQGISKASRREKGRGTVKIVGDYAAEPEALFVLSGARPGIDGSYRIESVSHQLNKKDGFVTSLTLRHPQDGAGTDSR